MKHFQKLGYIATFLLAAVLMLLLTACGNDVFEAEQPTGELVIQSTTSDPADLTGDIDANTDEVTEVTTESANEQTDEQKDPPTELLTIEPTIEEEQPEIDPINALHSDGSDWYIINESDNSFRIGFADANDNIVITPAYRDAGNFYDGLARISRYEGLSGAFDGFINTENEKVFEANGYFNAGDFGGGLLPVTVGYWGFVNIQNETVIPCMYNDVIVPAGGRKGFNYGVAIVGLNGAFGAIDMEGNFIVPLNKNYVPSGMLGVGGFIVTKNYILIGNYMFSRDGTKIHDNIYSIFSYSDNGLLVRFKNEDSVADVVIDSNGNVLLDFEIEVYVNNYSGQTYKLSDTKTDDFSEYWFLITRNNFEFNAVSMNGELLFNEWRTRSDDGDGDWEFTAVYYDSFNVLSLYSSSQDKTFAYDSDGKVIWSAGGKWEYWTNGLMIKNRTGGFFRSPDTSGQIANIYSETTFNFGSIEVFSKNSAIVKDENAIFLGLFVNDKLAYDTIYTKIDNKTDSLGRIYTLHRGNETEKILVTHSGTIRSVE